MSQGAHINANSAMLHKLAEALCGDVRSRSTSVCTESIPGCDCNVAKSQQQDFITSDINLEKSASVLLTGRTEKGERYLCVFLRKGMKTSDYQKIVVERLRTSIPLQLCVKALSAEACLDRYVNELEKGYDKLRAGILFADAEGHVLYLNACARSLLCRAFGTGAPDAGNMHHILTGPSCSSFLSALIKAFCRDECSRAVGDDRMITAWRDVPQFDQRLPFHVMALDGRESGDAHYCLVFPDPTSDFEPAKLFDGLGLTAAESRLASQIFAGKSIKTASAELSLSEESARTYLKRVFSKLGVSRQAELVSAVTRLCAPVANAPAGVQGKPLRAKTSGAERPARVF
ncbi:MAG: helix-turn-helix transcriptional regulator [Hyphomicrobium sp.]